jgi:pimeloyl-ACP methyl ester carboxylesterase
MASTIQLRVHDHEVAVRVAGLDGARSPVVCLHSSGLSGSQWRRLSKQLARLGHPVLAPDLLGYGHSDAWKAQTRFETSMDLDVVRALSASLSGPFHCVGHSYGGRLALALALEQPDEMRSLGAYEPVAYGVLRSSGDRVGIRELEDYDHDGKFLDEGFGGTEPWIERFVDYWSGDGTWRSMSAAAREGFTRSGRKLFEEVKDTCADTTSHSDVARLPVPTLVISGADSRLSARRVCAVMAASNPEVKHIELEEGVHMSPLLSPLDVNDHFLAHIAAHEPVTDSAP